MHVLICEGGKSMQQQTQSCDNIKIEQSTLKVHQTAVNTGIEQNYVCCMSNS